MIKNIILYLFICLSIACAVIIAYKRKTKKGKFLSCLILIFCAAVVLLVNIFPVENLWMKFNNPEEIIEYDKKGTADNIIIGKDSCMIVYSTGNQHNGLYFAPKNENNYILPNFFTKKNIHHEFNDFGQIDVYNVSGTDDYYVCAFFYRHGDTINFSDSLGSNAVVVKDEILTDSDGIGEYFYYCLNGIPSNYSISVNGEEKFISIKE